MGQQQLLLIVLGVIIVGIAVVVGINLFNANAEESAKDTLVSEGTNIGAMAQQFYKKPVALGGGGNSFTTSNGAATQFTIPPRLANTASATWTVVNSDTTATLTGVPVDPGYAAAFDVTVTVGPTTIASVVNLK
jgi:hypothetical protein